MKSTTVLYGIMGLVVVGVIVLVIKGSSGTPSNTASNSNPGNNVTVIDGKQIIEITAKGGYTPKTTVAKAGVPTALKINTSGTYDCSSALRIPNLKIAKNLPPSGSEMIDIGTPQAGPLNVTCSMGMYNFTVNFQS